MKMQNPPMEQISWNIVEEHERGVDENAFGRFYIKNDHASKRFTSKHFLAILASITTIYETLLRYERT